MFFRTVVVPPHEGSMRSVADASRDVQIWGNTGAGNVIIKPASHPPAVDRQSDTFRDSE